MLLKFVAIAILCHSAFAQASGRISGLVLDISQSAAAGATVSAEDDGTHMFRQVVTARDGSYVVPALPAARYTLRVSCPGFTPIQQSLSLGVAETARVDFTLAPSAQSETVEVTGTAPALHSDETSLSTTINGVAL